MINNINSWKILFLLSILIISCSDEENSNKNIATEAVIEETRTLSERLNLKEGEVKMFTMPTPLQIGTALNLLGSNYNEDILLEHQGSLVNSDVQLSLLLGMYLTDLGYTTIYNNTQKSIDYAQDIQVIMEELPISQYTNDDFKIRFENNIENRDSLCKIILDGYNMAHQHIDEAENKNLGLLILTGSYIEGLYLASSANISRNWIEEYDVLFIQQKLFLDNFLSLLPDHNENKKTEEVHDKLSQLKVVFDNIEITFNHETDKYELVTPITTKTHDEIATQITEIRNSITK